MTSKTDGVWVTYDEDLPTPSGLAIDQVFTAEVGALRRAVKTGRNVTKLPYGMALHDALAAERQNQLDIPAPAPRPVGGRVRKPKEEATPDA